VFITYAATKEADTVASAVIGLLVSLPKDFLKILTFDSGNEFAKFEQIKQALGIEVYFAHPCHSWERGTNENRNDIVRMVLSKGRSFDDITEEEMRRIDYMLNDRQLKCLNWRTPRKAFTDLLKRYLPRLAA
jgi:IS30 family transposase